MGHTFWVKAANTSAAGAMFNALQYAVQVKQYPWVLALIKKAKLGYRDDAQRQLIASVKQRGDQQIAKAVQHKLQQWLDTAHGSDSALPALVRSDTTRNRGCSGHLDKKLRIAQFCGMFTSFAWCCAMCLYDKMSVTCNLYYCFY